MKLKLIVLLMLCTVLCEAQNKTPGDFPQGSDELLEARFLSDYGEEDLALMRNEIFARYGYIFKKPEYREHFAEQAWYKPSEKDIAVITAKLTEIEKSNVKLIQAYEAWLKPVALRKLPRLSLPLDLEKGFRGDYSTVTGITPHFKEFNTDHIPTAIVGLLADTTRYFAVLWYENQVSPDTKNPARIYYVTTYTKKLQEIATAAVSLQVGRDVEYGGTDCSRRNSKHASIIHSDFTYSSEWTWDEKCPEDTQYKNTSYGLSGRINSDGTINVIRKEH